MDHRFRKLTGHRYVKIHPEYTIQPNDLQSILRIIAEDPRAVSYPQVLETISNYLKSNSVKRLSDLPKELRPIAHRLIRNKEITLMRRIGLDVGTKNIVLAYREGDEIKFKREINGFCLLPRDGTTKTILKDLKIPNIPAPDGKHLIALGSKAEEIAYTFGTSLRRPMERGVLSVSETEAMDIMAVIVRAMIGKIDTDTILYYCIPADAINEDTNVAYHQKIVQLIIDGHKKIEGDAKLEAYPVNEARALVLSQFSDKTGIGVSFGAGMVNVSFCLYGLPVYEFSIVGSGDWIDYQAARATGLLEDIGGVKRPKALVAKVKESIDLGAPPKDNIERAIILNYEILIENVANAIISGFRNNEKQARASRPMPIICAGGTSMPEGFIDLFEKVFSAQDMPFEVGDVKRSDTPLYSVAEGCLVAAEAHDETE